MKTVISVLFGILIGIVAVFGAIWKWGDKLEIRLAKKIAEAHSARVKGEVTAERIKIESIRLDETTAKLRDAELFSEKQEKKMLDQRIEQEKAAVKARIEANRQNTTPAPRDPEVRFNPSATPPPVIPTPNTPPPIIPSQTTNVEREKSMVLEVKKGDWFFYTKNNRGESSLVTTGDLPKIKLDPGETEEDVQKTFAKLLNNARIVREIEGQDLSEFQPMGHLMMKGKKIEVFGVPYDHQGDL